MQRTLTGYKQKEQKEILYHGEDLYKIISYPGLGKFFDLLFNKFQNLLSIFNAASTNIIPRYHKDILRITTIGNSGIQV